MQVNQIENMIRDRAVRINVADLIFNIIREVSGNDISTTINDSKVTKEVIKNMIDNKLLTVLGNSNNVESNTEYVEYSAKSGTILNDLVEASIPLVTDVDGGDSTHNVYEIIRDNIEAMGKVNGRHSVLMNNYVNLLSTAVSGHIKLAKSVVLPQIKALLDSCAKNVSNGFLEEVDPLGNSEIIIYDRPELIDNADMRDILSKFEGADLIEPIGTLDLGEKSIEEIILGCTTGDRGLDDSIIRYLRSVPGGDIYNSYSLFYNPRFSSITYNDLLNYNGYDRFIYGLVGYMYSRKLVDNIPDNTNMSLKEYIDVVTSISDFCGSLMFSSVGMIDSYIRTQTLLLSRSDETYNPKVCVNGPIYREWIKDNNEVLVIAASMSKRPRYTVDSITSHKEELMNEWETYIALTKIKDKRDSIRNLKVFLSNFTYNTDMTDIELEYSDKHADYITNVKKNVDEYIENLTGIELEDLDNVCLHLIAKCRFYFTSSYTILSAMNEAYRINSNLNPREAALLSIIDYLVEYMSTQINANSLHPYSYNYDPKLSNVNPSILDHGVNSDVTSGVAISEGA